MSSRIIGVSLFNDTIGFPVYRLQDRICNGQAGEHKVRPYDGLFDMPGSPAYWSAFVILYQEPFPALHRFSETFAGYAAKSGG